MGIYTFLIWASIVALPLYFSAIHRSSIYRTFTISHCEVFVKSFLQKICPPVSRRAFVLDGLLPLFFVVLLWLIYALNIILNGNFEPDFPLNISFIKTLVAENVAKPLAELCRVVMQYLIRDYSILHFSCFKPAVI